MTRVGLGERVGNVINECPHNYKKACVCVNVDILLKA